MGEKITLTLLKVKEMEFKNKMNYSFTTNRLKGK